MSNTVPKIAQYKQIQNDILDKISTGYYKKDDSIPTELELSKTYNVSRVTVRRATDNLVAKGILTRTPGVGTFVSRNPATQKIAKLKSFTQEMIELGIKPSTKVCTFSIKKADDKIARKLNLESDSMIYFIERIRYGNNEPLAFEKTYMSVESNPELSIKILEESKYNYIEKVKKLKIGYSYHQTSPILPPDKIAKLFNIDKQTPIIKIGNTTYFEDGTILDYTELYFNSPKYQLNYIKSR
ncbi:GntR family transcriptional regulator [Haloimpatiens sp. FM7315]|uniref:GntR family transcriptional regulator n=1 Tax=Haloimpatiens sp. FM7315 TaxID=3298609 RepID=UPI0035A2F16B